MKMEFSVSVGFIHKEGFVTLCDFTDSIARSF